MEFDINGKITLSPYENKLILPVRSRQQAEKLLKEQEKAKYPYTATIKQERPKRSKDANAYSWVLCQLIAKELSKEYPMSKDEVYEEQIRQSNYFVLQPILTKAVDKYVSIWENRGIGWKCEIVGKSKLDGYTNVRAYYGSSAYDSKEMSNHIDRLIVEAKELGIETLPPEELNRLVKEWGE